MSIQSHIKTFETQLEVLKAKAKDIQDVAAEHFLNCMIENREPISSDRDSLEDLRVMEGVLKAYLKAEGKCNA